METAIKLEEKFDGHIILYLKGQYIVDGVTCFEGLRNIWAVRCAMNQNSGFNKRKFDESIANRLFSILRLIDPKKMPYIHEILHRDLVRIHSQKETPIEKIILCYINYIIEAPVNLIEFPIQQEDLFQRIISGNALKGDYELVIE